MVGQVLARTVFGGVEEYSAVPEVVTDLNKANVITSKVDVGSSEAAPTHKPVLDIDLPVTLIPSSTPGHFHLFIDKAMTWENYAKLMDVLAEVGILESGYVNASKDRGFTAVRVPWVKKDVIL